MDDNKKQHKIFLDNRQKLSLIGVNDVFGFNEETVNVSTDFGGLVIRGTSLHISKLNLDIGEVEIDGNINSLQYTQMNTNKSLMQRIFS